MVVDEEWFFGDFVVSGGEFLVMVMIDVMVRLIFGVFGYKDLVVEDFFF